VLLVLLTETGSSNPPGVKSRPRYLTKEDIRGEPIPSPRDDDSRRLIAGPTTILRGLVGSSVHGLVLSGTDDRDEMGVCVEPRRYVVGFGKFEHWVYHCR
jgi:hypothetical protein